ncbi:hypothetical protein IC229_28330 [Spirosoma sp. BT702]|uniref:Uncharacterized protein n=1 Tax=Spirosoma profusum TaxID=2771354 RepID=A0A926Y3W8_9BACT|nr:hypothetical protein [Spirosoma profusum]MBD2704582.1 hypothetical protein [Spirosoma profusum]
MLTSTTDTSQSAHRHQSTLESKTLVWTWLGYLLVALPVVVFALVWNAYAINIPKWDDHALRAFLYYSDQETTFSGKIYQLFKQHNEHRIVYDRIVTLLDYWLFSKLNFVHLMVVGNLSLVGLLALFIAVLNRAGKSILYAIPVSLLIFNLSHWENMYWGMAALQNFSVVLWIIAAFYFLSYTRHWGLAFIAATLATITSGNGLVVWPIGLLIILLRSTTSGNRTLRSLISWLVGGGIVIGLYFTGFEKPQDIAYVRPGIIDLLKGWFAFTGAAAEVVPIGSPLRSSIALGGLMAIISIGLIGWSVFRYRFAIANAVRNLLRLKSSEKTNQEAIPAITLFFWACAAFLLGTAAIVAWARTGFGAEILITSRYKMYSLTLLALLYVYLIATSGERIGRWLLVGGGVGAVAFAAISYLSFLDETIWWRHWFTTSQFNWTYTTNSPVATSDSVSEHYTDSAPAFYDSHLQTIYAPAQKPVTDLQVSKVANAFMVQNSTIPAGGLGDNGTYLIARSDKRTYLFPVWQNLRSIRSAKFMPANLFTDGFKGRFLSIDLEHGTYQLFILTISDNNRKAEIYPTNQTIFTEGPPVQSTSKNW